MLNAEQTAQSDRVKQLLLTLGKAYIERQQYAEAYEKFKQLLALERESPDTLLYAAIAAVGMNATSAEMLALYEDAVKMNPRSNALRVGLATLFSQHSITTPFAISICEQAVANDHAHPHEQKIRLFLKKHYEMAGEHENVQEQERIVVFKSQNLKSIRSYLEGLWLAEKFAEALHALENTPQNVDEQADFVREKALTHAYMHIAGAKAAEDDEIAKILLAELARIDPARSIAELRDFLTLRAALPDQIKPQAPVKQEIEEYQFILGELPIEEFFQEANGKQTPAQEPTLEPFDLNKTLLEVSEKPSSATAHQENARLPWRSILLAQTFTNGAPRIPAKLLALFSDHLAHVPESILRKIGTGFLSLAASAQAHAEAMVKLLRHVENYNSAVQTSDRITLIAALFAPENAAMTEQRQTLTVLHQATHFLRIAEQSATADCGAGVLLVHAGEQETAKIQENGTTLLARAIVRYLPGKDITPLEAVWRQPLADLQQGQTYRINRYEVTQQLQEHNTYTSFLATDKQLDRAVMVKIMSLAESIALRQDQSQKDRLLERIRTIGRLNHPNIANLYDMGEHNNMNYFVREYVEGCTLMEANFAGPQCENEILGVIVKITRALQHAQRNGAIHLNLKPANIWMSDAQEVKLTDFRIVGFVDDMANAKVLFPAHWRYTAPEILAGQPGDIRSDIYSIGVIAYELLVGKHPYTSNRNLNSPKEVLPAYIQPIEAKTSNHHAAWNSLILKALESDPDERFQTYVEVDLELRKIQLEIMQSNLSTPA